MPVLPRLSLKLRADRVGRRAKRCRDWNQVNAALGRGRRSTWASRPAVPVRHKIGRPKDGPQSINRAPRDAQLYSTMQAGAVDIDVPRWTRTWCALSVTRSGMGEF